ncbi:uncharacterized protein LOC133034679 [Cannabis sativa]|uniref:uncharacterized protein LOC133034679 n=1 Tax=Cannabis sativa TaxID=3483 RepID=UPI0029CA75DB|nr:uncharacterized protein LOC133034679 [Cannabis sativa]XP_060965962.1 uncharacterized protein LOC133034679 [Cannabis sativa]
MLLFQVGNDRPSFDIMGSLLAQSENVEDLLEDKKIVGDDNVIEASKRDSESTDDGITSAEMLIISEKVDAVCHDYELKKSMEKSKVIDLGSAGTPRDLQGVIRIDFGDSSGKSVKIGETKYLKGLHPFNSELLDPPHCLQQDSFDEWFLDGFNDQNKKKKFVRGKNMLDAPLDFSIDSVSDKWWFYDLLTPGRCLSDSVSVFIYIFVSFFIVCMIFCCCL